MPDRILVINPNSTHAVTRAIRDAESETAACRRLLQRSVPAFGPRGDRETGARDGLRRHARYRADLEGAVRIPVVERTQAAVTMAIGRVRLGW